jgi:hypothetical protein
VTRLEASVAGDKAAIFNAQTRLGYTTISPPIDGVTGILSVDIGNIQGFRCLDDASASWPHNYQALALKTWSNDVSNRKCSSIRGVKALVILGSGRRQTKGAFRWPLPLSMSPPRGASHCIFRRSASSHAVF